MTRFISCARPTAIGSKSAGRSSRPEVGRASDRLSWATRSRAAALAVGSVGLLFAPDAPAAVDTWLGNASTNFSTLNGFNTVPQNGDTLLFGPAGVAGASVNNDIVGLSLGGAGTDGIDFSLSASPFTIAGNAITLASSGAGIGINDLALNAETINVPLTLASAQTINVGSIDGSLTLGGAISGAGFTLTKTGAGLLTLSGGTNTFTNLTVTGGVVAVASDGNLGSTTGSLTLDGGTLRTTVATVLSATRGIALGDANAGTGGTIDTNGVASTYNGVLSNNGGTNSFTKTGAGTLTIGGASTYTGNTNINQGILNIDFTQTGAPASNIINPGSTLVLGGRTTTVGTPNNAFLGATLQVGGVNGGNSSQTFNGVQLNAGYSTITATPGTGTAGVLLNLGAITYNGGGIVNFTSGTPLTAPSATNAITATNTLDNGLIGGWATVGNADYATISGGNVVAYTGYTNINTNGSSIADGSATNVRLNTVAGSGNITLGATTTNINTLLQNTATAATVALTSGQTLRLGANGGLMTGTGKSTLTLSGGTLTAGNAAGTTGGTINLNAQGGNISVGSVIANNGSGVVNVVYNFGSNGAQYGISGASNTYTGSTYILGGRVQSGGDSTATTGSFGTGPIYVYSGGELYTGNTLSNNVFIAGNGASENNGAIRAQGGTLTGTVTLQGDARITATGGNSTGTFKGQITGNYNLELLNNTIVLSNTTASANNWGGNTLLNGSVTLQLGASNQIPDGSAAGNVIFTSGTTLNLASFSDTINGLNGTATVGQGTVTNTVAGASVLTVGANDQSSTFNGLITDGGTGKTLGIGKTGAGTLVFGDAANAYLGGNTISGGTLRLSAASGATNSSIGAITGPLTVNTGGTLDLNSFSQTVGSLAGTGGVITSNVAGTPTLTVGTSGSTASTLFAGSIKNGAASSIGLTIQGGTLDLTGVNTYTGATNVTGGALQLGSGGSIGGTSALNLSGSSGLILGDANGAVSSTISGNFTAAASSFVAGGAATNSTLTLNSPGTASFTNVFGGTGTNQNNLNLVIAGTGTTPTTVLSAPSTYTGTTTVNSGATLNISGSLGGTSGVTVNSGATITGGNANNVSVIAGNLTVAGGGALTLTNSTALFSVGGNAMLGGTGAYPANHSTLNFTLGSGVVELFNVNGTLTLGTGGVFVNVTNPTQIGTFTLANYGGSPTGFSLSSTTAGVTSLTVGRDVEKITSSGGALTLTISGASAPTTAYFNGAVSSVWNDLSNATKVNFSSNLAGTTDAGNIPGAVSDVILNATNAPTNRGSATLSETLGASTTINSLTANNVGTTTLAADGSTLTINAMGAQGAGIGIVVAANANPFTINTPVALGGDQSWTNNSANLFTVGGTVTGLTSAANTLTLANTGTGGTKINGVIADGAGGTLALVVANTGAGVTTLTGANTYSGGTTLISGTLTATNTGSLGAGFVSVDPTQNVSPVGTAADNATLNSTGSIASMAAVTVNSRTDDGTFGVGTLNLNGPTSSIGSLAGTGSGSVVLNNAAGTTLTVGNDNTSTSFTGSISNGAGTGSLVKVGTGTLDLSGVNTYTGTTAVQNGALQIGAGGSLAAATAVTLGSGTTSGLLMLGDANGAVSQSVASLATSGSGAGNAVVGGSSSVSSLTINNTAAVTYNGVFGGTGTNQNNLAVTFAGTSPFTLSNDSSYTGGTTVNAGSTVVANTVAGLGANAASSIVTVASGGNVTLNIASNPTYNYTFAGGGKVLFNFSGGNDTNIAVNSFNGFTGTIEVANTSNSSDKLEINGSGLTGVSGASLQIDNGAQFFVGNGTANFANISLIGVGNPENRGAIRLNVGTIGGTISLLGNASIGNEGGTLTGNIGAGIAGTQTLTMGTANSQGTALLSGVLNDGIGQLALTQAFGTTTLSGANTYTGPTVVTGGSLVLSNSLAVQNSTVTPGGTGIVFSSTVSSNAFTAGGLTGSGALTLQNNAGTPVGISLTLSGTSSVTNTYSGILSGPGSVTKAGASTQAFSGANTYAGTTTISGGTLLINGNSGASAGAVSVNGGTLGGTSGTLGGATTVNSGGAITGGTVGAVGMLTITNSLTLANGSTYLVDIGAGSASDLLVSNSLLSLGATIQVNSGTLDGVDTYTIATYQSDLGSTFALANAAGYSLVDSGTSLQLVPLTAIPEPSTWVGVAVLGASGLALRHRFGSQPSA